MGTSTSQKAMPRAPSNATLLLLLVAMVVSSVAAGWAQPAQELTIYLGPATRPWSETHRLVPFDAALTPQGEGRMLLVGGRIETRTPAGGGQRAHVWLVNVEEYLPGVVAAEIGPDAPRAAMQALAVVARTFALRALRHPQRHDVGWPLCLTIRSQAYRAQPASFRAVATAIEATRGKVLVSPGAGGRPVLSFTPHHASCGGYLSCAAVAWPTGSGGCPDHSLLRDSDVMSGPAPDLTREVTLRAWLSSPPLEAWCWPPREGLPSYAEGRARWQRVLPAGSPEARLMASMEVLRRGPGGHIAEFRLNGRTMRGDITTRDLIEPRLQSSRFVVDVHPSGQVVLRGGGAGHGVGMCQLGARARAAAGQDWQDMLAAYFPESTVVHVSELLAARP